MLTAELIAEVRIEVILPATEEIEVVTREVVVAAEVVIIIEASISISKLMNIPKLCCYVINTLNLCLCF